MRDATRGGRHATSGGRGDDRGGRGGHLLLARRNEGLSKRLLHIRGSLCDIYVRNVSSRRRGQVRGLVNGVRRGVVQFVIGRIPRSRPNLRARRTNRQGRWSYTICTPNL